MVEENPSGQFRDKELEDALRKAAIGGEYREMRRETVRDKDGNVIRGGKALQVVKEIPPDASLLKEMLGDRIGGPQDYC